MYKEASGYIEKIFELLNEIDSYNNYKSQIIKRLDNIFELYQQGRISSLRYEELKRAILKGKTKKEVIDYYNSYIILLLNQVHNFNTLVFDSVYRIDLSDIVADLEVKAAKAEEKKTKVDFQAAVEKPAVAAEKVPEPIPEPIPEPVPEVKPFVIPAAKKEPEAEIVQEVIKPEPVPEVKEEKAKARSIMHKIIYFLKIEIDKLETWFSHAKEAYKKRKVAKAEEAKKVKLEKAKAEEAKKKAKIEEAAKKAEKKRVPEKIPEDKAALLKKGFFERLADRFKFAVGIKKVKMKPHLLPEKLRVKGIRISKEDEGVRKFSLRAIFAEWIDRVFRGKNEYIAEETFISPSLVQLADISFREFQAYKGERLIDPEHLLKEAQKIKRTLAQKKATPVYKPLLLGSIANVTVRRLTNYLMSKFPNFFNEMYRTLRLANIQVLSNTYANIMIFATSNIFIITSLVYTILSILRFQPLLLALVSGLAVGLVCGAITFFAFYFYPNTAITSRRKNIQTNLPFAINHIAAIASSGVPPVAMFGLIAKSREYGEICVELQKIVDYIEMFGYDLVTAVRAVSALTPDEELREFFEGMLNTIESGGELEKFMLSKAQEAMVSYDIERRKYTETVSTYSDMYTGILIAAPLFFVASLTLVSMLGGTVGGFNVSIIIGVGTYVVIPLMNIAFITFLNLSQPEI